ncbi:DUF4810 domain-containing protein [Nitrosospira briensis]|uniref:DUF4810 domain-containing protein n=1 Tax=Nitrosospira briensis TaxID=35799 RepID=UPI00046910E9|nr:DUF4810 domain-containing protein [Nitrosospira briensis]
MKNNHYSLSEPKQNYSRCMMLVVAIGLVGCSAPSIYHWGQFEDGLHDRYVSQNHPQADAYLLETITKAEQENLRIPPGAYADYGFLLFKRGDREGAIAYFEKEKRFFPESSAFMTKLIERVKQKESDSAEKQQPQAAMTQGTQP